MKYLKKLLCLILVTVFTVTASYMSAITVEAKEYSYRIKISLGNNANAYFDEAALGELANKYKLENNGSEIVISELGYKSNVSLDVDSLIKIKPEESTGESKYYVAGLRISGGDSIVTQASKASDGSMDIKADFSITSDENYVVAYGVGSTIPYTVKYVDEVGNELLTADTYFAARGEKVMVPARHVSGYYPDAYYRTASAGLKDDTVFSFIYKKYTSKVENVTDTVYETSTVTGEPVYEYQYVNSNSGNAAGAQSNNRAAGNGAANNNDGENQNGQQANGNESAENSEATGGTNISDEETPKDIIDIDEEEIAKSGRIADPLVRNTVMGITIVVTAIIIVAAALFLAYKNRNKTGKNE